MLNATLFRTRRPIALRDLLGRARQAVAEYRATGSSAFPLAEELDVPLEGELPAVDDIEAAAAAYFRAADAARTADRAKRAAKKILDRVPVGRFGAWSIERVPSARQTVDLEAVRAAYKRYGLGPVPMRPAAPSLRVTRVDLPAPVDPAYAGDER